MNIAFQEGVADLDLCGDLYKALNHKQLKKLKNIMIGLKLYIDIRDLDLQI